MIELYGRSACGKSMMCMWLTAQFCQHSDSSVLYIDTKNDLSAIKVAEMCSKRTSKVCHDSHDMHYSFHIISYYVYIYAIGAW